MKVYLLGETDYDHHQVIGIYASKESADKLSQDLQAENDAGASLYSKWSKSKMECSTDANGYFNYGMSEDYEKKFPCPEVCSDSMTYYVKEYEIE